MTCSLRNLSAKDNTIVKLREDMQDFGHSVKVKKQMLSSNGETGFLWN